MDSGKASKLLQDNLTSIYGYAFARLYDKDQVEDLAAEIICEVLTSVGNLKNEAAFWGFVWKIAENTFRKFIRREQLRGAVEPIESDNMIEISEESAENAYFAREPKDESIYLLRRELSLLTKTHREISVAYYIHGKSCSAIAKEKNVSVEVVKYHLFKTRKILKEGIGMTRKLGEKSYNPGTLTLGFWGDRNYYSHLCDRKLPGTILLAAYYAPMTAEELSLESGVAMPYLEDELEILEAAGVLKKVGEKYQTNIVIITKEYEKEFAESTRGAIENLSKELFSDAKELLPTIRALDFAGNDYDDNRLLFAILNMVFVDGYGLSKQRSGHNNAKPLALGGHGWLYGLESKNYLFLGITMETWNKAGSAWFSAENYAVIDRCQIYDHSQFSVRAEAMCDAILGNAPDEENDTLPWLIENRFIFNKDGKLQANFPVFKSSVYDKLRGEILAPLSEKVADLMIGVSDRGEQILRDHAPAAVRDQCGDIAKITHRLDVAGYLMENLVKSGALALPNERVPLCVYGVKQE